MSGNYGSEANGERSCYVTTGTGVSAAERCPEVERGGIPCGGILIREATPEDAPRLLEIYAYYVERTAITFEYDVPSVKEFRDRILHTKEKYPYLVGLGRKLYEALEEELKARGILNLYACIGVPAKNAEDDEYLDHNSEQFHAHMGYTTVGRFHLCGYKFGRWYDMIWMEKMIGEHC